MGSLRRIIHSIAHLHFAIRRTGGWRPVEPETVKSRDRERRAGGRCCRCKNLLTLRRMGAPQQCGEQENQGTWGDGHERNEIKFSRDVRAFGKDAASGVKSAGRVCLLLSLPQENDASGVVVRSAGGRARLSDPLRGRAGCSSFPLVPKVSEALWERARQAKLRFGGGRVRMGLALEIGGRRKGDEVSREREGTRGRSGCRRQRGGNGGSTRANLALHSAHASRTPCAGMAQTHHDPMVMQRSDRRGNGRVSPDSPCAGGR
ncbi:MAG: hypothetical protein QOE70_1942 [Chthoniobacter sp.]|nr:hypothetical protein [Chthoniobacter sp.]